jgi:hypothetical protein
MTFIIWGTTSTPECQGDTCTEVQFTFQKILHTNLAVSAEYRGMVYITSVIRCNGLEAPKTNNNFCKNKHLKIEHKIHPQGLI